jgi:hypothetical protein
MELAKLILEYTHVLVWPVTISLLLLLYRDTIVSILPKSKIKVSLFGLEVETTLSELETITLATLGGHLNDKQLSLLKQLAGKGTIFFGEKGISKEDRKLIRPIRNAGLVMTDPIDAHLKEAESLSLSPLGTLVMRSMGSNTKASAQLQARTEQLIQPDRP